MTATHGCISVVVVDDDVRVRSDLSTLLDLELDIVVVGSAADGATAVEMCGRLEPDVVVMDVRMPGMNGIEATRVLRERHTDRCRVLVVTTFDLDDYVIGAVRMGASGFLLKDQAPEELAAGVRTVAAGNAVVAPRATARLLRELVTPTVSSPPTSVLSARELDVVSLMAKGLSNDEIAEAACISRATVKSHVSSTLTKLGLSSRLQIVVWAYENGYVERDPSRRT